MECCEDLYQHKEEMLEASREANESHDFETKDLCVCTSYTCYEDEKTLKREKCGIVSSKQK